MGEGTLLARHCLACARTHSRQRLGGAAERDLRRVPRTHTPPPGLEADGNDRFLALAFGF